MPNLHKQNRHMNDIFHVHTFRCGHAEAIPDEEYIRLALDLNSQSISFTDHGPFPGDPFNNRMKYEELREYVTTINDLKQKYIDKIKVECALEIEYFPSYSNYYNELLKINGLDFLMLGQHFFEKEHRVFSFEDNVEEKKNEMYGLSNAIIEGVQTGYFKYVAHPDRIFRRRASWENEMTLISKQIIDVVSSNNIIIEQNLSSMQHKNYYWKEFWNLVPKEQRIIVGYDAHSRDDIIKRISLRKVGTKRVQRLKEGR